MYSIIATAALHVVMSTVLVLCVLPGHQLTQRFCKKESECRCTFNDTGGVINLEPLGSPDGTPTFLDVQVKGQEVMYSYNPCYPFYEDACTDAAICEIKKEGLSEKLIADHKKTFFDVVGGNLQVSYVTPGLIKLAVVSFVCVEGLDTPRFTPFGQNVTISNYYFQVESQCACENGCVPIKPTTEDPGLGPGVIILIVCGCAVACYIVIGSIEGKYIRKETGLRVMPQYDFWSSVPGMVKFGFVYVGTCQCLGIRSKRTYSHV